MCVERAVCGAYQRVQHGCARSSRSALTDLACGVSTTVILHHPATIYTDLLEEPAGIHSLFGITYIGTNLFAHRSTYTPLPKYPVFKSAKTARREREALRNGKR